MNTLDTEGIYKEYMWDMLGMDREYAGNTLGMQRNHQEIHMDYLEYYGIRENTAGICREYVGIARRKHGNTEGINKAYSEHIRGISGEYM